MKGVEKGYNNSSPRDRPNTTDNTHHCLLLSCIKAIEQRRQPESSTLTTSSKQETMFSIWAVSHECTAASAQSYVFCLKIVGSNSAAPRGSVLFAVYLCEWTLPQDAELARSRTTSIHAPPAPAFVISGGLFEFNSLLAPCRPLSHFSCPLTFAKSHPYMIRFSRPLKTKKNGRNQCSEACRSLSCRLLSFITLK